MQVVKFYNIIKIMRGFLLILFTFLIGINSTFAYDLVLPKEKKSVVTMNYAFFVGKANPNEVVSINDQKIYLASNGAFAHSVKLVSSLPLK